jgi:hypothetical protein
VRRNTFIMLTAVGLLAGCGRGDGRFGLSGSVHLDGAAVDRGSIEFSPAEGPVRTKAGAMILGGKYSVAADHGLLPGRYRVRVFWPQPQSDANPMEGRIGPPPRERIPERYNVKSELAVEVRENTANRIDFDLTTSRSESH